MDIRIFTLRFNPATECFDDEQMRDFIKDKEVVSMSDHFFLRDGAPYLTLVIGFHPAPLNAEPVKGRKAANKRDESWRKMLKKDDWPLFNTIRTWRNETAEQKGFPPYVICSNRELATIVVARPQSLNALGQIKGFGPGKLEKYGKDMLALLAKGGTSKKEEPDNAGKRSEDPVIFTRWTDFLEWLLPVTEKFPKRVRFTFASRIDNLALDIVEDLIEARYSPAKLPILQRINLRLEKLRVLLRLCHRARYLSHNGYEHASRELYEIGRMLGGWIKQQRGRR